jgi:hypothetical protein
VDNVPDVASGEATYKMVDADAPTKILNINE